jgi:hypothetical protein
MLLTNEKKLQEGVALAPLDSRSFRNRTNRERKSIPLPG